MEGYCCSTVVVRLFSIGFSFWDRAGLDKHVNKHMSLEHQLIDFSGRRHGMFAVGRE